MSNRPPPELLASLLLYIPETGELFWKYRPLEMFKTDVDQRKWNNRRVGTPALAFIGDKGYRQGTLLGAPVRTHRVIWSMQTGAWPNGEIDHIDRNRSNNRWTNLRLATAFQNQQNRNVLRTNKSGVPGVCWGERAQKWIASISANGMVYKLGNYTNFDEAAAVVTEARKRLHGEFAGVLRK